MKELEQCGWQKRVETFIIIHMTLVSMRISFQCWDVAYSAGFAQYQLIQAMVFGSVHHMMFHYLHHRAIYRR